MKINATLVEKVSKNGKNYICVEINITEKIKKVVFLSDAEIELLKLQYNK